MTVNYLSPASPDVALASEVVSGEHRELHILAAGFTGGFLTHHRVATSSTNAVRLKAAAAKLFGWSVFNKADYPIYLKFHNVTTDPPVAGTSAVVRVVGVQAGMTVSHSLSVGQQFDTGLGFTITKLMPDTDTTAIVAEDCVVAIDWF